MTMAENDSDLGAFLAGFLIGGIIAAGAALLLAPQSGEETREMIRERGIELQHRLEQTSSEFRSKAESAIREGRERIDEAVEGTKQRTTRRKPGAAEGEAPD
jgi:gas vesicle protein